MLYPSMKQLLKQVDSRYLLVNVAAKRAREIADAAQNDEIELTEKPVRIAINEIAEGKLYGKIKDDFE